MLISDSGFDDTLWFPETSETSEEQRYIVANHLRILKDLLARARRGQRRGAKVAEAATTILRRIEEYISTQREEHPSSWVVRFDAEASIADILTTVQPLWRKEGRDLAEEIAAVKAKIDTLLGDM
ncbi:MAG: hypothetical protein MI724_00215 [Spirochaetales bacterium]|nr:hypothetical protein [Spirochaetales bacterium]